MHDNINPIYEPVTQEDIVYPLNDGQLLIVTEDSLEINDVLGRFSGIQTRPNVGSPIHIDYTYRVGQKIP